MAYQFTNLFVLQETEKAFHVEQTRRNEKVRQWIPKSVCTYKHYHPLEGEKQYVDLHVEDWFVEKDNCKLMI